jgi:AraC-like DNA-binding protein
LPPQSQKTIAKPAMIQVEKRGTWARVLRRLLAMTSSSPTEKILDDCSEPRCAEGELALAVAELDVDAGALRDERDPGIGPAWELHHYGETLGLAVGYSSPSHFAHVFRREVGVSPTDYRR